MADLEDFFAKRDKKKKTKGQKFETTGLDDVAKILDAKVKERKKQETNKSTYQVPVSENGESVPGDYRAQEDDEWKEVVEEKPDYTGLKIQELVLEDEDVNGTKGDGDENGDAAKEGPWRKTHPTSAPAPVAPAPVAPAPVAPAPVAPAAVSVSASVDLKPKEEEIPLSEPIVSGEKDKTEDIEKTSTEIKDPAPTVPEAPKKYVSPAVLRAQEAREREAALLAASTASTISRPVLASANTTTTDTTATPAKLYLPPSRRLTATGSTTSSGTKPKSKKKVAAPNINDEQYFPSLGGEIPTGKHS